MSPPPWRGRTAALVLMLGLGLAGPLAAPTTAAMPAGDASGAGIGPKLEHRAPPLAKPTAAPAAPVVASANPRATPRPSPRRRSGVRARGDVSGPLTTIARANAAARDFPSPAAYVNATLYYDFEPGRLYTVHASPRFLTAITLKPGEKLISKAAGDTVRWVIGETLAGAGEATQVVIFIKPIRPDLRTNIVLTTDQRTYLIDAVSTASGAYTSMLSWNYPRDLARAEAEAKAREAQQPAQARATRVAEAIAIERLNFRYRVEAIKSRPPAWRPVRVFDDGAKTFIEFPSDLATREAPPLFLLGDKDQAELVNYRQSGVYYVVDRVFDRAELRLGAGRQTIVRITRQGGAR